VIAIALDAARELNENDEQYRSASQEFFNQNVEKYGVKAFSLPLPPEIDALRMHDRTIVDENTNRLRQALGEQLFRRFDEELSRSNRSREAAKAGERGLATAPAPRQ
jgi:hypothetical protein